jgi:hypothetical protein
MASWLARDDLDPKQQVIGYLIGELFVAHTFRIKLGDVGIIDELRVCATALPTKPEVIFAQTLKATKGGFVCYRFLSGKDKAEIAKELKSAFGLSDWIMSSRSIIGRTTVAP